MAVFVALALLESGVQALPNGLGAPASAHVHYCPHEGWSCTAKCELGQCGAHATASQTGLACSKFKRTKGPLLRFKQYICIYLKAEGTCTT
jgi:hypothetical protein